MTRKPSRPPMVTPWGKCSEAIKVGLPEELEFALKKRATDKGSTLSEVIRNILLANEYGEAAVEAWLVDQFRSTVKTSHQSHTGAP